MAYKKPLPRGGVPIPGEVPVQKDNPPAGTAPQATFPELQQAAQTGHWDTRGTPRWEPRAPQLAPVDQGHGDQSQQWRSFDGGHNAPRLNDPVIDQRRQFAHGEQVVNPHRTSIKHHKARMHTCNRRSIMVDSHSCHSMVVAHLMLLLQGIWKIHTPTKVKTGHFSIPAWVILT